MNAPIPLSSRSSNPRSISVPKLLLAAAVPILGALVSWSGGAMRLSDVAIKSPGFVQPHTSSAAAFVGE